MSLMKGKLKDRKGQVWEWLTPPVERYYITKSWLGEHFADGMPVTFHEMINLNTGVLIEQYIENDLFEDLSVGANPEMQRLL